MTKKTKVKETQQYDVSVPGNSPGVASITKTVNAANDADAMRNAMQGDPKSSTYKQINVTKRPPAGARPMPATATPLPTPVNNGAASNAPAAQTSTGTQSTGVTADVSRLVGECSFPYAIMLPVGFKPILEKLTKGKIGLNETAGKVYMKISDPATMTDFLTEVFKSKDPRVALIRNGIKKG